MSSVESQIKTSLDSSANTDSTVTFPSQIAYQVHDIFFCDASDTTGQARIVVTVTDQAGDLAFHAQP